MEPDKRTTMRREGFDGQHLIIFPEQIQSFLAQDPLSRALYITHIGYFPNATNHLVDRSMPCDGYILICCHNGSGWCKLGDLATEIKKGDMLVIPAREAHCYGSQKGSSWEVSWIHFAGSAAADIADALCGGRFGGNIRIGDCTEGFTLFSDIIAMLERGLNADLCRHASMQIWHYFSALIRQSKLPEPGTSNSVTAAIDFMHDHIEDGLSLSELSQQLKLSAPYLCRIFKEQTGHSPMDYFNRLKIQKACKYLDLTDLKVREVADKLGYDDPYYFSRAFKKVMQSSPANYRLKSKGLIGSAD
jgi:AraC-like DNA-binding protein